MDQEAPPRSRPTPPRSRLAAEAKKFDQRDPAVKDWLKATYGARMLSAMGGMVELSKSCATDATFRAASEEFGKAMDM